MMALPLTVRDLHHPPLLLIADTVYFIQLSESVVDNTSLVLNLFLDTSLATLTKRT